MRGNDYDDTLDNNSCNMHDDIHNDWYSYEPSMGNYIYDEQFYKYARDDRALALRTIHCDELAHYNCDDHVDRTVEHEQYHNQSNYHK